MHSFREHSVEDFWRKLHGFFGCCQDLIEEGLKLLLAVFAGSENLLHDHVLSLCDLILNVIADSVFGDFNKAILLLDCFHVVLLNCMQRLDILEQIVDIIFS